MTKIIVVFGATGSQGGSVAKALANRSGYKVRATTRNVKSAKAEKLREMGCEVVEATYQDYTSLVNAMTGAYGAWFITSFWDQPEHTIGAEIGVGHNVGRAAKECGIKHLIYSSLESPAAMGSGVVFPTFDGKIGVEQELRYLRVPLTCVQVAWYFNNLENNNPNPHAGWYPWPKDENGVYILEIPIAETGLHGIHSEDVGEACASIFDDPEEYIGHKVAISGELLQGSEMEKALKKTFPDFDFKYVNTPIEDYLESSKKSGFGDALYQMYKWYQYRMPKGGDIELTKKLNPDVNTFESYLDKNKRRFKFEC